MVDTSGPGADYRRERLHAAERFIADGRYEEAAALIDMALKASRDDPEALNAHGALCLARREFARATEILGAAATAYPDHPSLVANLGIAHQASGHHEEARLCLRRAVALAPRSPMPLQSLAMAHLFAGDFDEARAAADALLTLDPEASLAPGLLGLIALVQGEWRHAAEHFQEALSRGSTDPTVWRGLSICRLRGGDTAQALALAEKARIAAPLDVDTLEHLARCQAEAGLWSEAEATCLGVLAFAPDHLGLRVLHARIRMALGEQEKAIADLTRFTRAHSGSVEALVALAAAARQTGQFAQARPLLREALKREPDHARALMLDAEITLALGERLPRIADGVPPETRILVPPDMTAGEFVVLSRFLPRLADERGRVKLSADDRFLPLAAHLVVTPDPGDPQPGEATLPLPMLLRCLEEGAAVPYLHPDPRLMAIWHRSLCEHPRPWIGIMWDGEAPGLTMDRIRDAVPAGASAVSLMVGRYRHALADWPNAIDAGDHFAGFADMIAVIGNLDFVLGPDTAPLHIAGALGRPGAIAVATHRPWYWAGEGERALWYPSLQLVRQSRIGRWDEVVARLRDLASIRDAD